MLILESSKLYFHLVMKTLPEDGLKRVPLICHLPLGRSTNGFNEPPGCKRFESRAPVLRLERLPQFWHRRPLAQAVQ